MERVHPQARFDQSGRRAHVVHAAPMCGSPRPTSGHSRGPALSRAAPLLPPGSSTNSTRLSRRRAAQRCRTGALRCSRRRSPAFRGCLTMLGCCFEPFLPASNASTGPRRREPDLLPGVVCRCRTDPRRSVAAFNPRECSRPLGCRSTADAADRAVLPPHTTCRPRIRNVVADPRSGAARTLLSATAVVLPNARCRLPANVHCFPARRTLAPPGNLRQQSASLCDSHGNCPQHAVRTRRARTVTAALPLQQ